VALQEFRRDGGKAVGR